MKKIYFVFYLFTLLAIGGCEKDAIKNSNEPKIRVIFLDSGATSTSDSIKVTINSVNGIVLFPIGKTGRARYLFPINMNADSTNYKINYTVFRNKKDTLREKGDTIIFTPYPINREKEFTIYYKIQKIDTLNQIRLLAEINPFPLKDSVGSSCPNTSCLNTESDIYIYDFSTIPVKL